MGQRSKGRRNSGGEGLLLVYLHHVDVADSKARMERAFRMLLRAASEGETLAQAQAKDQGGPHLVKKVQNMEILLRVQCPECRKTFIVDDGEVEPEAGELAVDPESYPGRPNYLTLDGETGESRTIPETRVDSVGGSFLGRSQAACGIDGARRQTKSPS